MKWKSEVQLIPEFHSSSWGNSRRIYVYVPPSYEHLPHKRYPVLYMHAGQRIFQQKRSDIESWDVHLACDRLIEEGKMEEIIVVGIAHLAVNGANEFYHPIAGLEDELGVTCNGLLYEHFIIEELKPYIDHTYRTKPEAEFTGLMGSSGAAVSAYHSGLRRPDIFGKIGLISPYFVKNEFVGDHLEELRQYERPATKQPLNIWLDNGTHEGLFYAKYAKEVADEFLKCNYTYGGEIVYLELPGAGHFEQDWAKRIHMPLIYFFGNKGNVQGVELAGRSVVGLKGPKVRINALIHYSSGMIASDLDGQYEVEDSSILSVERDGTVVPKTVGATKVTYRNGEHWASRVYEIIPVLSENVTVKLHVAVPQHTPHDADIYVTKILDKIGNGQYYGELRVPRDTGFKFRITRGFRQFELDRDGNEMAYRMFTASEDMELSLVVENWKGLLPENTKGGTKTI